MLLTAYDRYQKVTLHYITVTQELFAKDSQDPLLISFSNTAIFWESGALTKYQASSCTMSVIWVDSMTSLSLLYSWHGSGLSICTLYNDPFSGEIRTGARWWLPAVRWDCPQFGYRGTLTSRPNVKLALICGFDFFLIVLILEWVLISFPVLPIIIPGVWATSDWQLHDPFILNIRGQHNEESNDWTTFVSHPVFTDAPL